MKKLILATVIMLQIIVPGIAWGQCYTWSGSGEFKYGDFPIGHIHMKSVSMTSAFSQWDLDHEYNMERRRCYSIYSSIWDGINRTNYTNKNELRNNLTSQYNRCTAQMDKIYQTYNGKMCD